MVMKRGGRHMNAERQDMDMDGADGSMAWCCHHHHWWLRKLVRDIIVIAIAVCLSLMLSRSEQWHWHVNKFDWLYHQDMKAEQKAAMQQQGQPQPAQHR